MGSSEEASSDLPTFDGVSRKTQDFAAALEESAALLTRSTKAFRKLSWRGIAEAEAVARWLESVGTATRPYPELEQTRASLLSSWGEIAARGFLQLEARLRDLAKERGWRLEGQWPELYVERGIRVEVDEKTHSITVGTKRLRSTSVQEIVAVLDIQLKDLVPRGFSPGDFIATLAAAYDADVDGRVKQRAILEVYRAFVIRSQSPRFWRDARPELFIPLSADQFRARLSRALEASATTAPDGRELRLLPPLNPKDAMFLYLPSEDRFGYVGRIEFLPRPQGAGQ